jgi:hypothetical protein
VKYCPKEGLKPSFGQYFITAGFIPAVLYIHTFKLPATQLSPANTTFAGL